MEQTVVVLGGIVVALVSGIIGKGLEAKNSVKKMNCGVYRDSCQRLLTEKIDNLSGKVDALTTMVNSKILGI